MFQQLVILIPKTSFLKIAELPLPLMLRPAKRQAWSMLDKKVREREREHHSFLISCLQGNFVEKIKYN